MNNKVVIIGCGNVGMSYAYALLNQRTYVNRLVLIDLNKDRIEGEVMDLNHCLPYAPSKISINIGDYQDCKDANIVMIAAGAAQKPGETRMDLIHKNAAIFKDIIDKVMASCFNGIFLVATNPLDVMTYLTYKYSKLPANKVIGSGTSLDTARLQNIIGKKLCINPKNIQGFVIGEHGDSEFIPWSNANIGLQNIREYMTLEEMAEIENEVRNAAYEIINKKGASYYGIGMALVRITNLPAIVNKNGADRLIKLKLTEEEKEKLNKSISIIKNSINNL